MPTIAYPAHLESDVVLRNGRTLRIRPVRPDDAEGLKRIIRERDPGDWVDDQLRDIEAKRAGMPASA